ncbi:topoisomerase C-terminal repeat-containing protein (plasmid) [Ureibacillus chungkukjangi]|uniref:type IA DNA topoisomerase n=1 Tax=Ureibacillus chungkukjangi TaxID=1202712 RepID=UPI000D3BDF57|nr:type IA DNA topoisomerase [Ureibacillus chungkukjangi]
MANIPNTVIIAEKPQQASTYAAAYKIVNRTKHFIEIASCNTFKRGAVIVWGFGHLLQLRDLHEFPGKEHLKKWEYATLPAFFDQPEMKVSTGVEDHFEEIKRVLRDCILRNPNDNTVWVATDPDREGSAIAWNLINAVFSNEEQQGITFKRLFIKSLEKDAIHKGFLNPYPIDKDKRFALEAYTRSVSDFLVGINGTRIYSILLNNAIHFQKQQMNDTSQGKNQIFNVGRVQTAACYLVYDRQMQIDNFIPKEFFELYAEFHAARGSYRGKASLKEDEIAKVQELLRRHNLAQERPVEAFVKEIEKNEKREQSPKLHSLTTLQTKANRKWKLSPKQVLQTIQTLYEKYKLLSYPRTDCQYITDSEFVYLRDNVENYKSILGVQFDNKYLEARNRYVRTDAVQEHYAIVPTKKIPDKELVNSLTITERNLYLEVVRTTLAMFHDDYVYEQTNVITDLNGIDFKSTGKIEILKGFKALWTDEEVETSAESSKTFKENEEQTQNLPLLDKNERSRGIPQIKSGVTRPPSAYTEGELLKAMETCGSSVEQEEYADILKEVMGIGTVATRADIIETIKNTKYIEVAKNKVRITEKGRLLCISVEGTLLASPILTAKWESFLKKIGEGTASSEKFIDSIEKFVTKLVNDAPLRIASKPVQDHIRVYLKEEQDRTHFGICPKCNKGTVVFKKSFYGCTEYKNGCGFQIWPKINEKNLTVKQIKTLIEKQKTGVIKGFKSKTGNLYEGRLSFDNNFKVIVTPEFKKK